jgi:hypothetical protein
MCRIHCFRINSEPGKAQIYECKTLSSSKLNCHSLFSAYLTFSISKITQHQITECERKLPQLNLRNYSDSDLEQLRKTTQSLSGQPVSGPRFEPRISQSWEGDDRIICTS